MIFTEEGRKEFREWIDAELDAAYANRQAKQRKWAKWRRQRDARPEFEQKDYPWPKASNVSVPLQAIISQQTFGHLRGIFNVKDPFWTMQSMRKDDEEAARMAASFTRLLALMGENPFELDLRQRRRTILQDMGLMGTCFSKVIWLEREWQFRKGGEPTAESQTGRLHWGPAVVPIPVEDLIWRGTVQDLNTAPWVAHKFLVSEYELRDMAANLQVDTEAAEAVLNFDVDAPEHGSWRAEVLRRMGSSQMPDTDVRELHEVHARWDVNGDGLSEEIIVLYHKPTGSILQEMHNETGLRMITAHPYIERPFFVEGMGTGWLTEQMQDEADTSHNLIINAMHLTTLPIFVGTRGVGLTPDTRVYPGALFLLSSARDLVQIGPTGVPTTALSLEQLSKQYAQAAAGVPDTGAGFADTILRSGDTYRGQETRLRQQSHMFAAVVESSEDAFGKVGFYIFVQMAANREKVLAKERAIGRLTEQELADVEKLLSIPVADIPSRFAFTVRTTDLDRTYDVKRQNLLFQVQLQSQFYEKMMPVLMQMSNPQMPPQLKVYLGKVFTASMRTLDKILSFFEQEERSKFIPEYRKMEMLIEIQEALMGMQYEQQARQIMAALGVRGEGVEYAGRGQGPGPGPMVGPADETGAGRAQSPQAPARSGPGASEQPGVERGTVPDDATASWEVR